MKTKITIISPVHVGTGDSKMSFEYYLKNKIMYNYDLSQILQHIPNKQLLDYRFLNNLQRNTDGSQIKYINQTLKHHVNYSCLKSLYQLRADFQEQPHLNISTQIKALNKPIIPGSTIKGAIFNAIVYDFIKKHKLYNQLDKIVEKNKKNILIVDDMFSFVYFKEYPKGYSIQDFLKQLKSCLICRDVPFEHMTVLNADRLKVKSGGWVISSCVESIDINQEACDEFIIIDEDKMDKVLNNTYSKYDYYNECIQYLNKDKLVEVCDQYFNDMLFEELDMNEEYNFYTDYSLSEFLQDLSEDEIENGFYMRIGKNTNYFFKTISYLCKTYNPEFYSKYFYQYFSPKGNPKRIQKSDPKYDKMPATRTLYYDDEENYYPGVIKVEFIK